MSVFIPSARSVLVVLVVLATAPSAVLAQSPPSCGSVTHDTPVVPDGYGAFTPPAAGGSYVDAKFGCTVKRLTDAAAEGGVTIMHPYSSVNPFNLDSTKILLVRTNGVLHVRDLDGRILRDNLYTVGMQAITNPVWSRTDASTIYFVALAPDQTENVLKAYDV